MGKAMVSMLGTSVVKAMHDGFAEAYSGLGYYSFDERVSESICHDEPDVLVGCAEELKKAMSVLDSEGVARLTSTYLFRTFLPFHTKTYSEEIEELYKKAVKGDAEAKIKLDVLLADEDKKAFLILMNYKVIQKSLSEAVGAMLGYEEIDLRTSVAHEYLTEHWYNYFIITSEPEDVVRVATRDELNMFRNDYLLGHIEDKVKAGVYEEDFMWNCLLCGD